MRFMFLLIFAVLSLTSCASSPAREGFNPAPSAIAVEVTLLSELPAEVNETSGLARRHGRLWTHNDSGNAATLFELSEAGDTITRRIHLKNTPNQDWEALAQDDTSLYIADCGNNAGDRDWMQIYKVSWQQLDVAIDSAEVFAEEIQFKLADTTPARNLHAHNNDCEALTVLGDELWLFTKNWQDRHTRLYRLNNAKAVQEVASSGEFFANGLITGADYDPQTQRLALIGYRLGFLNFSAFIWILPVVDNAPQWDHACYLRINPMRQWEAILWHQGDLLLTSELSLLGKATFGRVSILNAEGDPCSMV